MQSPTADHTLVAERQANAFPGENVLLGITLLGGFNLPDVPYWCTMTNRSKLSDIIFDIMLSFNLSQIIHHPTRVQGSSSAIVDFGVSE